MPKALTRRKATTRSRQAAVAPLRLSHPEPHARFDGDPDWFDKFCDIRLESHARKGVELWTSSDRHAQAIAAGEPVTMYLVLPSSRGDGDAIEMRLDRAEGELLAALGLVRLAKQLGYGGPLLQRVALDTATPEELRAFRNSLTDEEAAAGA